MSINHVPSKKEVMGWTPQSLADYLRRLNLSGCDKAVMRSSISGAKFLQMADSDLQVFPCFLLPAISKLQNDICKGEQRKPFTLKAKVQKFPQQAVEQQEEVWDSDEFDNESDHDADSQEEDYICAIPEQQDSDEGSADDVSPTEMTSRPPLPLPLPPRINIAPPRPPKAPGKPSLPANSSRNPAKSGRPQKDPKTSKGSLVKAPSFSTSKVPKVKTPKSTDVSKRTSKPLPIPGKCGRENILTQETRQGTQELDPSWYVGQVTRHQAEATLRGVNKDGAFTVRDSSNGSEEHPYTLMLLKQEKVYNIKIRNQGNSYSLGNGLNNKMSFPGVKEMITHHTRIPLLLIDVTDHSSEPQSQSCLLYPAGH